MRPDFVVEKVKQTLTGLLEASRYQPRPYRYGFVIHPRLEEGRLGFGVITASGESCQLTSHLLGTLAEATCWIYGRLPVRLDRPGATPEASAVPHTLRVTVLDEEDHSKETLALLRARGPVTPDELVEAVVVLTHERPEGWPA
jgi:hypothetical protein